MYTLKNFIYIQNNLDENVIFEIPYEKNETGMVEDEDTPRRGQSKCNKDELKNIHLWSFSLLFICISPR